MEKKFYGCRFGDDEYKVIDVKSIPVTRYAKSPNRREIVPEWMLQMIDTVPGESYYKARIKTRCEGVYFFGMVNSNDIGCGSWSTPVRDFSQDFFAGDEIGEIRVNYSSGMTEKIPLIIGFTAFWYSPWSTQGMPFGVDGTAKEDLLESLYLQDVYNKKEEGYLLPYKPLDIEIDSIEITGNPKKTGYPLLYGITLMNPDMNPEMSLEEDARFIPLGSAQEPGFKHIDSQVLGDPDSISRNIEKIQRHLYTCEDEMPEAGDIYPEIPEGYVWPRIYLNGDATGRMLANQYMNVLGQSIMGGDEEKCKAIGAYGGSADFSFRYKHCIGIYHNGSAAGGTYWTRDLARIYIERMKAGDTVVSKKGLDFYAKALYGHGTFIPGPKPHWVQNYTPNPAPGQPGGFGFGLGLPTRTTGEKSVGNLENDGHGLVMLAIGQYYTACGYDKSWLSDNWQVIDDAAEWFCYQIDNPIDVESMFGKHASFYNDIKRLQPEGLLYSENESANYGSCDTFNNAIGYYALLSAAMLAGELGNAGKSDRFNLYAQRLMASMKKSLTETDEKYGTVWKYFYRSSWQDFNETLAPVFCAIDVYGLDSSKIDPEVMRITRNTYDMLIHRGEGGSKYYYYTRSYGYGQSFIMEAALLLDEMEDFEKLAELASRYMYSKREHRWLCAEGSIAHESGKYWYRHNGIGNEVQVASFIRVIRIMLGIDDANPDHLFIFPRIPETYLPAIITDYKVVALCNGKPETCTLKMGYSRDAGDLVLDIESDRTIDKLCVKLPASPDVSVDGCEGYDVAYEEVNGKKFILINNLTEIKKTVIKVKNI
ncbi:MAG: hypothetical protein ACYCYI_07030 [Saccharofermentanales bacterium]